MEEVTMIDYGAGNVRSVQKALEHVGARVAVTADPAAVRAAERLVLPGVGAFGAGMAALRRRKLVAPIRAAVESGTPFLGICLGMQLLFEESEEMGRHEGLDLLPGRVRRFTGKELKVPHMGWNQIQPVAQHPILHRLPPGAHAYFVHSYYCEPAETDSIIARTDYETAFAAIIARDNVVGIQFHPEKSQQVGLRLLENYLKWSGGGARSFEQPEDTGR
ncbi:MAG: imidazole glycerol phosphate synthase subunit HisH [Candidatus Promineifilaceae bacterium]|nr:imidazole glycerol phosphate synthase subunit HisH [Candidatus Promineifilaceae bacterium]